MSTQPQPQIKVRSLSFTSPNLPQRQTRTDLPSPFLLPLVQPAKPPKLKIDNMYGGENVLGKYRTLTDLVSMRSTFRTSPSSSFLPFADAFSRTQGRTGGCEGTSSFHWSESVSSQDDSRFFYLQLRRQGLCRGQDGVPSRLCYRSVRCLFPPFVLCMYLGLLCSR